MNYSPQRLASLLESKGYILKRVSGSHHIYFNKETRKTIVVPMHGNKDLAKSTFFSIIKQAGISKDEI
jgi:predicted RNA binding protein YcfA (HicA-like mRNA interferase family)